MEVQSAQISIETIMTHICGQIIAIIKEQPETSPIILSQSILSALSEAHISITGPKQARAFTDKQRESQSAFATLSKTNAQSWAVVKTQPEELAFWKDVARRVPKKVGSNTVLSTWNVFTMFKGNRENVPAPNAEGFILRPSK